MHFREMFVGHNNIGNDLVPLGIFKWLIWLYDYKQLHQIIKYTYYY